MEVVSIEYNLKNDIYFKEFFTRNVKFTKNFLESVLKEKIDKIEVMKDVTLDRTNINDKLGILDLKVILNDEKIVDVEMQICDKKNWKERAAFYGSKLLTGQYKKGDNYKNMKKSIVIAILDFNITDFPEYCEESITVLREHREYEIMDMIKYYFIQLPKYRKENSLNSQLDYWLTFIDYSNKRGIEMIKKKEEMFVEAEKELEYLTGDEELQRFAELREKAEMDEREAYITGFDRGEKKGIEQGIEKGEKSKQIEIAKKMKEENFEIEVIVKMTGLTKEEIEKL